MPLVTPVSTNCNSKPFFTLPLSRWFIMEGGIYITPHAIATQSTQGFSGRRRLYGEDLLDDKESVDGVYVSPLQFSNVRDACLCK